MHDVVLRAWMMQHPWRAPSAVIQEMEERLPLPPSMTWSELLNPQGILSTEVILRMVVEAELLPREAQVYLWCALALGGEAASDDVRKCLSRANAAARGLASDDASCLIPTLMVLAAENDAPHPVQVRFGDVLSGSMLTHERALALVVSGRGRALVGNAMLMSHISSRNDGWVERFRFFDAVESGRIEEAAAMTPEIHLIRGGEHGSLVQAYTAIAWLMQVVLARLLPEHARAIDGPQAPWRMIDDEGMRESVRQLFFLVLDGRKSSSKVGSEPGFVRLRPVPTAVATLHIRHALAQRRFDLVNDMISRRWESGVAWHVDDMLSLRCRLEDDKRDHHEAGAIWAGLEDMLDTWSFRGRCEFELRSSGRISYVDMATLSRMRARHAGLDGQPGVRAAGQSGMLGSSEAMTQMRRQISIAAASNLPLLIVGETGSGKELVAKAVHLGSSRSKHPFVAVNCAALNDTLLESELFGHARGSFSGAATSRPGLVSIADQGVLFLDEIGDTTRHFQAALLRLLESGDYRPVGSDTDRKAKCRIIAATNADLQSRVASGDFRRDLYHRLDRLRIVVPSLRERRSDIPGLADYFVRGVHPDPAVRCAGDLVSQLMRQDWPGNVRELRNRMEEMAAVSPQCSVYGMKEYQLVGREQKSQAVEVNGEAVAMPVEVGLEAYGGRDERRQKLMDLFRKMQRMTRIEVARSLGVSTMTATAYLRYLCNAGLIEKVQPNRAPRSHYFAIRIDAHGSSSERQVIAR